MRVLQVHAPYRQRGGEDVVVEAEAGLLRAGGHQVIQHHVENPPGALQAAGALTFSSWNPSAARTMRRVAEKSRPDVAHVHNTWFSLSPSILRALRWAGVPVVVTLHNYRPLCTNGLLFRNGRPCEDCVGTHPWRGVQHRCYRGSTVASAAAAAMIYSSRLLRSWERDVDLLLVPSEFARGRFLAGGLPADKLRVKPNFVADPGRRVAPPSASHMVLYVGRLSTEKGVNVLLRAWRRRAPEGLELVVVGGGPLEEQLRALAGPEVRFAGQLGPEEVRSLLLRARALLFPSLAYETFGLAVVEAMAAGLPVLASEGGSVAEMVSRLGPEWLAPAGDGQAWDRRLRVLADDRTVDRAGALARRLYDEHFGPGLALRRLEEGYRSAISSAHPA